METTKRPRIIYLLLAAMFIVTAAVAMPTTNAKYTTSKSYVINIESKVKQVIVNAYVVANTTNGSSKTVTLPYSGYYLIVAKGGDGADAKRTYAPFLGMGTDYSVDIAGGYGGTVYGIYQGTKNTTLLLCPGTAGNKSNAGTPGTGGENSGAGKFAGGNGNVCVNDDSGYYYLTDSTAGAGGGAGSAVYIDSNSGTLLMVAGGGGAGASWNAKWRGLATTASKAGGAGAGIGNNDNDGTANTTGGTVYIGKPGTGDGSGSYNSAGQGGGNPDGITGGAGGNVDKQTGLCSARSADSGTAYSSGGNGGKANCYGGGGGGGYHGGGGGAGTSIKVAAGGGGGGASFISSLLAINDSSISTYVSRAKAGSTNLPAQYTGTNKNQSNYYLKDDGDGYIIVYYLGSEYNPPA